MTHPALVGPVDGPELHVMTYNIRRRIPHLNPRSPDRWTHRQPLLARLLVAERPALLGVQEALPDQARFMGHALGQRYRFIGHGRQVDRRGEGCPIFYDRDRLELLGWEQTALSDTPAVSGSVTWGNKDPRVVVDATFRDLMTGVEFRAVNTHFDHRSHLSRMRSAAVLRDLVSASELPVVVTGDFNTDAGSEPYEALLQHGLVADSWNGADRRLSESWGTFLDYRAPRHGRKRIDWILTTPAVGVSRVGINVSRYSGGWPSDHAPVQAVIRLPGSEPTDAAGS